MLDPSRAGLKFQSQKSLHVASSLFQQRGEPKECTSTTPLKTTPILKQIATLSLWLSKSGTLLIGISSQTLKACTDNVDAVFYTTIYT